MSITCLLRKLRQNSLSIFLVKHPRQLLIRQMDVQKSDVSFQISLNDDPEYPSVLKFIGVKVTHRVHGDLGGLRAVRILRRFCKGKFLEVMDADSDELHQFSTTIFDKYGLIRPWLVNEGVKKGTGCWGHELDKGELVYITDISVRAPVCFLFCSQIQESHLKSFLRLRSGKEKA